MKQEVITKESGKQKSIQLDLKVYEQAMESTRFFINVALQICTALTIANVTVLGFAFSRQKVSLLVVAAITMVIAMILHRSVRMWTIPYIYSAILIERNLTQNHRPTQNFAILFFRHKKFFEQIELLLNNEISNDGVDQSFAVELAKIAVPGWLPTHIGSYALFFIAAIAEFLTAILFLILGWDLL